MKRVKRLSQEVIDEEQKALCVERGVIFTPTPLRLDSRICASDEEAWFRSTDSGTRPAKVATAGISGVAKGIPLHPIFFLPTHARHVYEEIPSVSKLLGLPPGLPISLSWGLSRRTGTTIVCCGSELMGGGFLRVCAANKSRGALSFRSFLGEAGSESVRLAKERRNDAETERHNQSTRVDMRS